MLYVKGWRLKNSLQDLLFWEFLQETHLPAFLFHETLCYRGGENGTLNK